MHITAGRTQYIQWRTSVSIHSPYIEPPGEEILEMMYARRCQTAGMSHFCKAPQRGSQRMDPHLYAICEY